MKKIVFIAQLFSYISMNKWNTVIIMRIKNFIIIIIIIIIIIGVIMCCQTH